MEINFGTLRDSAVNNATWIAQEVVKGGRVVLDAGVRAANTVSSSLLSAVERIKTLDLKVIFGATVSFAKSSAGFVLGAFTISAVLLTYSQKLENKLAKLALNIVGISLVVVGAAAIIRPGINFFGLLRV